MRASGAAALAACLTVATLAGTVAGGERLVRDGAVQLAGLGIAPGNVKPAFNGTRTGPYTVALPLATSSLKVTATASTGSSPTIEVKLAGGKSLPVTAGVACPVPLAKWGNTSIQVQVTGDGSTTVYTLIAMKPLEPDASLKSFSITPGTLQPAFKPLVTNYSIMEAADVASVQIMAVANDSAAQVKINGVMADPESGEWPPLPIAAGRNTTAVISVLTNHGQASANKLYFVNISRAWDQREDSSLKMLEVDANLPEANRATMKPAFSPLNTKYSVDEVPNASIVTISVAANQSDATIFIGNNNLPKDGASWRPAEITIPKRATDVKVRVTSPDGKFSTVYTVRLGSAGPGAANPADADYWQRLWGCGKINHAKKGYGGPCGLFWLALVASCVCVLMSSSYFWVRRRTRRFSDADVARYAHAVPDFRD